MGNDFIGKVKDPYRKGLRRSARKLTYADLFTMKPEDRRTILVHPNDLKCFRPGEKYILQLEKPLESHELHVYLSQRRIGISVNAPPSIETRVRDMGGMTIGALDSIKPQSGLVNVIVGLDPSNPLPQQGQ